MKTTTVLLLSVFALAGCVGQTRWEAAETQKNLASVKPGMTVDQVSSLIGKPLDREMVPANGRNYEVVRFQTKFSGDAIWIAPGEDDVTPFVFVEGKLLGWGKAYYQALLGNLKLSQ